MPAPTPPTRPLLMTSSNCQSILDGLKTETRRLDLPQPKEVGAPTGVRHIGPITDTGGKWTYYWYSGGCWNNSKTFDIPYHVGQLLWIKETVWILGNWYQDGLTKTGRTKWRFQAALDSQRKGMRHFDPKHPANATPATPKTQMAFWQKNSIHHPTWASRLTLEVTNVKIERLQDITKEDAIAEGIRCIPRQDSLDPTVWWESAPGQNKGRSPREAFAKLWDSINSDEGQTWADNPWIIALKFKTHTQNVVDLRTAWWTEPLVSEITDHHCTAWTCLDCGWGNYYFPDFAETGEDLECDSCGFEVSQWIDFKAALEQRKINAEESA